MNTTTADVAGFTSALLALDRVEGTRILGDRSPGRIDLAAVEDLVMPALASIGEAWERGEMALSQVYLSGRLCAELLGAVASDDGLLRLDQPTMAIAVLDDAHVLGSQIVALLLRSAGYRVSDWGSRIKPVEVVDRVRQEGTQVLFISTLMLRSALQVAELRRQLSEAGLHPVLVVGGAPFRLDPRLGEEVGADFFGTSAGDVLDIVSRIQVAS